MCLCSHPGKADQPGLSGGEEQEPQSGAPPPVHRADLQPSLHHSSGLPRCTFFLSFGARRGGATAEGTKRQNQERKTAKESL